jgi:hypothetical protein
MLPKLSPLPIHPPHCGWGETAGVADGAARELLRFAQQKHATEEVAGFLAHHPTALGVVQVRAPLPLTLYRAGGGGGLPGAPPHGAGRGAGENPSAPHSLPSWRRWRASWRTTPRRAGRWCRRGWRTRAPLLHCKDPIETTPRRWAVVQARLAYPGTLIAL